MPQQGGAYNMHPAFGGFMNDPTAQLGFQMGKTAMDAGQQYMEQNVSCLIDPSSSTTPINTPASWAASCPSPP
jgi:protein transport protein YIF1